MFHPQHKSTVNGSLYSCPSNIQSDESFSFICHFLTVSVQLEIRQHCSSLDCTPISLSVTSSVESSTSAVSILYFRGSQYFDSAGHISPTGSAQLSEDDRRTFAELQVQRTDGYLIPAFKQRHPHILVSL